MFAPDEAAAGRLAKVLANHLARSKPRDLANSSQERPITVKSASRFSRGAVFRWPDESPKPTSFGPLSKYTALIANDKMNASDAREHAHQNHSSQAAVPLSQMAGAVDQPIGRRGTDHTLALPLPTLRPSKDAGIDWHQMSTTFKTSEQNQYLLWTSIGKKDDRGQLDRSLHIRVLSAHPA